MAHVISEPRLSDLVEQVADRISDMLIELPRRYRSSLDMAVDVIHDQAGRQDTSYVEAARELLRKTPRH